MTEAKMELMPCPFCGRTDVAQGSSGDFISVWCRCGARGPDVPFPEIGDPLPPILECYVAWNRRPAQTADAAEVMRLAEAQRVVDEQAADGGIWFIPQTAAEAYLMQELRKLHAAVEGKSPEECAKAALGLKP